MRAPIGDPMGPTATQELFDVPDELVEADVYDSFLELELDEPGEDGDDGRLGWHDGRVYLETPATLTTPSVARSLLSVTKPAPRKRVVPFTRILKRGARGPDVTAVQIALRNYFQAKGLGKGPGRTGLYGPGTVKALRTFQKRRNLKVDGQYGKQTHRHLTAFMGPTAIGLMRKAAGSATADGLRGRIIGRGFYLFNRAAHSLVYTQGSARDDWLYGKITVPRLPRYLDCSSMLEWTYYPDGPHPSGWGWRAVGWTGSQIRVGRRTSSHAALIGDAVFYPGRSGIGHVTLKVSSKTCLSFGSEPMRHLSIWYRTVAFAHDYIED